MNGQPGLAQPSTEDERRAAGASVATMEHFSQVSDVYNGIRTTDLEPIDYIRKRLGTRTRIVGAEVTRDQSPHVSLRDQGVTKRSPRLLRRPVGLQHRPQRPPDHIGDAAMMLEKWNQTKQVQTDAAWVHDGSAAE